MLAQGACDSYLCTVMTFRIFEWATLKDYDNAKAAATDRIIKKQSRGNVSAQNGWSMTMPQLLKQSRDADKAMDSLRRAMPSD
ncbi:hypothetical protein L0F51_10850 [Afifella sp. H1R]|uniref:Uncharacterized protein n=1 Tax=Rhodopseudomonas julia TaxID=200617 RepID=A0ABU0C5X1_9BRAD|nr:MULTISPECIES: hypothetical protein [Hyphomicrobiales]MCF1504249.1 hypothetical protein [Afifella sp. H1R]MCT8268236.1 hypothetical protein [Afifella sp. JA880]MDQ0325920.1 hypothetical protein [Rhodopseudomonas julia]